MESPCCVFCAGARAVPWVWRWAGRLVVVQAVKPVISSHVEGDPAWMVKVHFGSSGFCYPQKFCWAPPVLSLTSSLPPQHVGCFSLTAFGWAQCREKSTTASGDFV
uniref:Uncharacterized protein n=1 Tax=Phasianus colchicus TaxID=9054 RepID=A0A669PED1_PHACC